MNKEQNRMWHAYLDGQLSVEETIRFEETLSSEQREHLEAERNLETKLVKKVVGNSKCPDDLWARTKQSIEQRSRVQWFTLRRMQAFAAAAVVLLVVSIGLRVNSPDEPCDCCLDVHCSVMEFCKDADIPGDCTKVASALSAEGFHITMGDVNKSSADSGHTMELLGMSTIEVDGKKVAKIMFSCCEKPIAVFVTQTADGLDLDSFNALDHKNTIHKSGKSIDKYRLMAIGGHPPKMILDLFS